jgi:hypothetical protein
MTREGTLPAEEDNTDRGCYHEWLDEEEYNYPSTCHFCEEYLSHDDDGETHCHVCERE